MKQAIRERINALNLAFYEARAVEFSDKRTRPWRGFGRVLAQVRADEPSVLDIGCGNGRLVPALAARFTRGFDYVGVDASAALLAIAEERHAGARIRFVCADFVRDEPEHALPAGTFACVCLFGLLHHLPGEESRRAVLRAARTRTANGGLLAFTLWRFDSDPRLAARRLLRAALPGGAELEASELDPGDALLRWGTSDSSAARYCHAIGDEELARLCGDLDLELVDRFFADGSTGAQNDYLVFRAAKTGAR